ncbi:MAG: TonB family protein [Sphingomicrobium sp.]
MLAYASGRQQIARRGSSPPTLLLIIGGHVTAVALVMSAKMNLPERIFPQSTQVTLIPIKEPPPPEPAKVSKPRPTNSFVDRTEHVPIRIAATDDLDVTSDPPLNKGEIVGPAAIPQPDPLPPLAPADPVRTGPRLATPAALLRPPYPQSRLESQQEAALRLRISIDARGRVVGVQSVGPADAAFLNAARKHLMAHWRYQPATTDGRAEPSTTVITLRFEITG